MLLFVERLGPVRITASDTIRQVFDTYRQFEEDAIFQDYKDVFTVLGRLTGRHHIQVDETVKPVVHAPRKVPVAIRETVEWERTRFVSEGVLAKVPKLNGANKDLH